MRPEIALLASSHAQIRAYSGCRAHIPIVAEIHKLECLWHDLLHLRNAAPSLLLSLNQPPSSNFGGSG